MKKEEFAIKVSGSWETREGWIINPFFVAYKKWAKGNWHLTHRPTGLAIFNHGFRLLKDIKSAAEFLTSLADWAFSDPDGCSESHGKAYKLAKDHLEYDSLYARYEWQEIKD